MSKKVVAIIGSYRKGGNIDRAVEAILAGAREKGAETRMIYLVDRQLPAMRAGARRRARQMRVEG
jgi:multimeric flavodoxin WrbA